MSSPAFAPAPRRLLVVAALLAVYVIWGSTYLAIKIGLETLPPFAMAAIRFASAGAVLLAILLALGHRLPAPRPAGNAAIMGTLLLGGGNGLVCYAQQTVSSGLAAVAVASMPLFAAVFAGLYGNWPGRRDAVGLAIGFAGVVFLNTGAEFLASPAGALALLLAPLCWAFGSVWSRRQSMPEIWMGTAIQMLAGAAALALASWATGEALPVRWTGEAIAVVAYLAVFGSLIGFTAYVYLLGAVRPALATSYAYVNPPIAIGFGVLFAGERLSWHEVAASAVILAGVALILAAPRR